jgi:hypothetical protein
MLFTIGIVILIVGKLAESLDEGIHRWNKIEIVGIAMSWFGIALMVTSIWILIWKYLP